MDINLKPASKDPVLGISVWSNPASFVDPLIAQHSRYESRATAFYSGMILEMRKRFNRLHLAVKTFGPQGEAIFHADKLGRNSHLVAQFANAAFEDAGDVQLFGDFFQVLVIAVEAEGRSPRHHAQPGYP